MSYDIYIVDSKDNKIVELKTEHNLSGGIVCIGGMKECYLNMTYNYNGIIMNVLDNDKGIKSLDKLNVKEAIPILKEAISKLGDDIDKDYWKATEGNVKIALMDLYTLAMASPSDSYIEVI